VFAWGGVMVFAATGRAPFGVGPLPTLASRIMNADPHGGGAQQMLGPGGSSSFGFRSYPSINVTLVSAKKGRLLVSITPGTPGG